MSKTYYEAQISGRIFLANQLIVRSFSDTVIALSPRHCGIASSRRNLNLPRQGIGHSQLVQCMSLPLQGTRTADLYGASAFRDKDRAQPICTVYQPSVTRYRHSRLVQCTHLPRYATRIPSQPRQAVFHHKSPAEATVQDTQSCSVRHMDGFQYKPSGQLQ